MTLCHIHLKKVKENKDTVTYSAFSPDFNDAFENEKVADVIIHKSLKTYEFKPGEKGTSAKTLPPKFFSYSKEKQDELLENEYRGYGSGAWTMRIHWWITQLLEEGDFPDRYPN